MCVAIGVYMVVCSTRVVVVGLEKNKEKIKAKLFAASLTYFNIPFDTITQTDSLIRD